MAHRSSTPRFVLLLSVFSAIWAIPGAARLDAVSAKSPLTFPAPAFIESSPHDRTLVSSIARGSLAAPDGGQGLAGVHLPDGARITALAGTFLDQSASEDLKLRLFRRRIGANPSITGLELALVSSSGSSAALQLQRTEEIDFATIDNGLYIYWVTARLKADMELVGAQLEFLLPILNDGFESGDTTAWSSAFPSGYVSPWVVSFADAIPESLPNNACFYNAPDGSSGDGVLYSGVTGGACCFVAPVHLPDGVSVTSVFFYLSDESSDGFTMSLRRKRIGTNTISSILGTVSTSGSSNSIQILPDVTITDGLVDNTLYTYFVSSDTCLDQEVDLRFYQALIFYSE